MQAAASAGLRRIDQRGMRYLPIVHRAWWTADLSVNYIASFAKEPEWPMTVARQ